MPARIARSSAPQHFSQKSTSAEKRDRPRDKRNRNLDAFAIAQEENPEKSKLRKHRLGESDFDTDDRGRQSKRQRTDDDDGDDEDDGDDAGSEHEASQKAGRRREFDGLDADGGSDSEGNEWHFGFDGEAGDEDEDIDSDEAFGESDEERFGDYTFRGSSSKSSRKARPKSGKRSNALDEDDDEANQSDDGDESDGSLGSDAVDLATILDQPEESEDEQPQTTKKTAKSRKQSVPSEHDGASDDDMSSAGDDDDDEDDEFEEDSEDDEDSSKLAQLRGVVDQLEKREQAPSDDEDDTANLKPGALLAAMQQIASGGKRPSRAEKISADKDRALAAPLPKRQQDKVNRAAAYKESRETLGRWQDTVKHNREADHLIFPLVDPNAQEALGTSRMIPATTAKPRSKLENAIQGILAESGLVSQKNTKDEVEGDTLPENKPSLKEVKARRAELRRARDLLFREEQRSKRVKKIKSKAYRRVHRREREKNAAAERDLLEQAGVEMSEDEKERADRRRAEERMGARHKDSKWARNAKKTGQLTWNDDARAGVEDMARRDEDLRRRIQGHPADQDSASESSGEDDDSDDGAFALRTAEKLDDLDDDENQQQSRLSGLKFMQRAETDRKKANDDAIAEIRRDLAIEDGEEPSSEEEQPQGRRSYGTAAKSNVSSAKPAKKSKVDEFEEGSASENDEDAAEQVKTTEPEADSWKTATSKRSQSQPKGKKADKAQPDPKSKVAFSEKKQEGKKGKKQLAKPGANAVSALQALMPPESTAEPASSSKAKTKTADAKALASVDALSDDAGADSDADPLDEPSISLHPSQSELIRAAFATDDTADRAFAKEKAAAADDEGDKYANTALEGWGTWGGAGLSKSARKSAAAKHRRAAHVKKTQAGVAREARRDARLAPAAIVSERRVKKNARYLAPALPFPFESAAQYERGLRVPLGREWNAKSTFEDNVKPRVLLKQGVVRPMERPM